MEFEWDEAKYRLNQAKHHVDFRDLYPVFDYDFVDIVVQRPLMEGRRVAIGHNVYGQFFFVVRTWRNGNRRIISARRAGRNERQLHGRAYGPLSP